MSWGCWADRGGIGGGNVRGAGEFDRGGIGGSDSKGGGEFCRWMGCGVDGFWLDGLCACASLDVVIVNLVEQNKGVPKIYFWWGNFRLFFSFILNLEIIK